MTITDRARSLDSAAAKNGYTRRGSTILAHLCSSSIATVMLAVMLLGFSSSFASAQTFQGCQPTTGRICQGSSCNSTGGANPTDTLTYENMTADNIEISVTNVGPRTPCDLRLAVQEGNGLLNGTDFDPNNSQNGDLQNVVAGGPAKTVAYLTTQTDVGNTVAIKIGPPTGSNQCTPQNEKEEYNYAVTCIPVTPPEASITLEKSADPEVFAEVGQVIQYDYIVTNTGNETINDIEVTDNLIDDVSCIATSLDAGGSTTCTGSYEITDDDIDTCSVTNLAEATGTPESGGSVEATAQATITSTSSNCVTDPTRKLIKSFLKRRVDLLASNEPDRARMMRRFDRGMRPDSGDSASPLKLMGRSDAGVRSLDQRQRCHRPHRRPHAYRRPGH